MSTVSILWLACAWVPALVWWIMRNDARFKKNIVVGVTLPREAHDDVQVNALLEHYRREELVFMVVATAVALAATLAGSDDSWAGPLMVGWSVWLLLVVFCPNVMFALTNRRLAALKDVRGWRRTADGSARVTVADIGAAAQQGPRFSGAWFALLLAASLVPALLDTADVAIYLVFAACVVMMWVIWRWCYRDRSEVVDEDATLTQALTRIRRRQWARTSFSCALAFSLFSWAQLLFRGSPVLYGVSLAIITMLLCGVTVFNEMRTRSLQERLTQGSGEGFYVDEDDHWIFGLLYYNPDDSHLVVNERVGLNSSFNLARPAGKVIAALLVLVLAAIPLLGALMADEMASPVTLELSGEALSARHSLTGYEIPLDDIESFEVIAELPQMTRTFGGAADTFLEGDFSSERYGALKVCLDPGAGPWLLVRTEDGTAYLLGASDADETEAVAQDLEEA